MILTRPYVCAVIPPSGSVMDPKVFKQRHLVRLEDDAKCLIVPWKPWVVGSNFYFLTLKSMCIFGAHS